MFTANCEIQKFHWIGFCPIPQKSFLVENFSGHSLYREWRFVKIFSFNLFVSFAEQMKICSKLGTLLVY